MVDVVLEQFAEISLQDLPEVFELYVSQLIQLNLETESISQLADRLTNECFRPNFPEVKRNEHFAHIKTLYSKLRRIAKQKVEVTNAMCKTMNTSLKQLDFHIENFAWELKLKEMGAGPLDHLADSEKWRGVPIKQEYDSDEENTSTRQDGVGHTGEADVGDFIDGCRRIKTEEDTSGKEEKKVESCLVSGAGTRNADLGEQSQESMELSTSYHTSESKKNINAASKILIATIESLTQDFENFSCSDTWKRDKNSSMCSSTDDEVRKTVIKKKQRLSVAKDESQESRTEIERPSSSESAGGTRTTVSDSNAKKSGVKNGKSGGITNVNTKSSDNKDPKKSVKEPKKVSTNTKKSGNSIAKKRGANLNSSTKGSSSKNTKKSKKVSEPEKLPEPSLQDEEAPVDPDEPLYCTCRQGYYGAMVACDDEKCPIEWYHFECVGLSKAPKGKWYCKECSKDRKKKK